MSTKYRLPLSDVFLFTGLFSEEKSRRLRISHARLFVSYTPAGSEASPSGEFITIMVMLTFGSILTQEFCVQSTVLCTEMLAICLGCDRPLHKPPTSDASCMKIRLGITSITMGCS